LRAWLTYCFCIWSSTRAAKYCMCRVPSIKSKLSLGRPHPFPWPESAPWCQNLIAACYGRLHLRILVNRRSSITALSGIPRILFVRNGILDFDPILKPTTAHSCAKGGSGRLSLVSCYHLMRRNPDLCPFSLNRSEFCTWSPIELSLTHWKHEARDLSLAPTSLYIIFKAHDCV